MQYSALVLAAGNGSRMKLGYNKIFYATWCGPCKMVAPILDELAKEYDGQIVIYKVDTDKETELARAFGIRSIPSILFIPMNGKPEMAQGALPKEAFKKAIDELLLKK